MNSEPIPRKFWLCFFVVLTAQFLFSFVSFVFGEHMRIIDVIMPLVLAISMGVYYRSSKKRNCDDEVVGENKKGLSLVSLAMKGLVIAAWAMVAARLTGLLFGVNWIKGIVNLIIWLTAAVILSRIIRTSKKVTEGSTENTDDTKE